MEEKWNNNQVELCGTLAGRPVVSHKSREEVYYTFPLAIERLSGAVDTLNIVARQEQLEEIEIASKTKIKVQGEVRSFNNKSGTGSRLVITIFAKQVQLSDEEDCNHVQLKGVLCKLPNPRKTPMGREICDLLLATSRRYGRSDYLPCISWGQNAAEARLWQVGDAVLVKGRVQSRTYIKQEDEQAIEKTAFEISVIQQEKQEIPHT